MRNLRRLTGSTACALLAVMVLTSPAQAEHTVEDPNDPSPPHTVYDMSVDVQEAKVDVTGLVQISGTVTCDRPSALEGASAELELDVSVTQDKRNHRAYGAYRLFQPTCGPVPTTWTITLRSLTGANFVPGRVQIGYSGDDFVFHDGAVYVAHAEGTLDRRLATTARLVEQQPPAERMGMTLDVDSVTSRPRGAVVVTGTITCDRATTAEIYVSAQQSIRRSNARADGSLGPTACGPTASPWSLTLTYNLLGRLRPGALSLDYRASSSEGGVSGHVAARLARVSGR